MYIKIPKSARYCFSDVLMRKASDLKITKHLHINYLKNHKERLIKGQFQAAVFSWRFINLKSGR